tara:strand:- start:1399 stop:1866 length:468 start_codon:yes stop_codon:yes gene_type:complete
MKSDTSKELKLKMQVPCSSEFVGVIRLALSGVASRMNFPIDVIEDIKVSVSEACTNVIQHAYGNTPNPEKDIIDIETVVNGTKLTIIVKDYGKGFNLSDVGTTKQVKLSQEKLGLGLGLEFIKNLMDDSKFVSDIGKGTTIEMSKNAPEMSAEVV